MREITDGSAKFRVVDRRLKAMIDMLYPVGIVVTTATDDALKPGGSRWISNMGRNCAE